MLKPLFSKGDSNKHFAYSIHSRFRHRAIKANISDTSSITLAVGFPAPCPALVSTWMRSGLVCLLLRPTTYCRVAMNFSECRGTTRSSWSAVSSSVEGYWMPSSSGSLTLCSGEYLRKTHKRFPIFFLKTQQEGPFLLKSSQWHLLALRIEQFSVLLIRTALMATDTL